MAIESNDDYMYSRNLVARIAKSQKKFIPIVNLRRQNIRADSIIARHPDTFCVIGEKRVYLTRDIEEYVRKYGKEPEVARRRGRSQKISDGPKATGRQTLLYVPSNTAQDQHTEEWTVGSDVGGCV